MAREAFPVGASVDSVTFDLDPYPWYARLLAEEPVSWVPAAEMWFVAPAELCKQVLRDDEVFAVGFERSTVADILGEHMMSVDGEAARRYKRAFQPPFLPGAIRDQVEPRIALIARGLVESFCERGEVELRSGFAGRLPVLVMLGLLGLPAGDELLLRRWYDAFEAALANTGFDPQVRRVGKAAAAEFHEYIAAALGEVRGVRRPGTLLDDLVHADPDGPAGRLTDEEIALNAGIVMFGGISTVEALVLDAVWALGSLGAIGSIGAIGSEGGGLVVATRDPTAAVRAVHETIRWQGPVQTAHRVTTRPVELGGVHLPAGTTVACLLAAANRDPAVFEQPEVFDPERHNAHAHLGFAAGQHHCLGSHLAIAEGRIALTELVAALPGLRLDPARPSEPAGSEFRQPDHLWVQWDTVRA